MAKKKKHAAVEEENDQYLRNILRSCKLPLLTLDERYHELFPEEVKTPKIKALENRLNALIKNEGKLNTDIKEMKALKKRLLDQVLENMGTASGEAGRLQDRKQEKLQELVKDINAKTIEAKLRLEERPEEIRIANENLMVECLKIWYRKFRTNKEQIGEINAWVKKAEKELKTRLLTKQNKERENHEMYSYMHALLGPHVMEELDASMDQEEEP